MSKLSFRVDRSRHQSLTDQVERGLRHAILTGVYSPGDHLPTLLAMAAQLEVSEIIVRRAVGRLSEEGLLKGRTRTGIRVCDFRRRPWRAHVLYLHWSGAGMYYHSVLSATLVERLQEERVLVTRAKLSSADAMHDYSKVQTLLDMQPPALAVVEGGAEGVAALLEARSIPFLHFAREPSPMAVGHVTLSSTAAEAAVVEHCRSCGVRSALLAMVGGPGSEMAARLAGAGIACEALAVTPATEFGQPAAVEIGGLRAMQGYLAGHRRLPDLIYFGDDFAARGGLLALLLHGLHVPEDVQVISLANRGLGPVLDQPLTRIEMDPVAHGAAVADAVLRQLARAKGDPAVEVTLSPQFIVGETTRLATARRAVPRRTRGSGPRTASPV